MPAFATSKLGRSYLPVAAAESCGATASGAVGPPGAAVDWRVRLSPVRDQGSEGACFAHAVAALAEFNSGTLEHLSPRYLTWRTRAAEWSHGDAGAYVANAISVAHSFGCCHEAYLPYEAGHMDAGNAICDAAAWPHRVGVPCVVDTGNQQDVYDVLAAGRVIAIGFRCYASFESTGRDGHVPDVPAGDGLLGGHAVLIVGWNDSGLIVRNSWGCHWADGGYCYMPASYLSHVTEAWTAAPK